MLIRRCAKPDKNGDPLTHAASAAAGHALLRMPLKHAAAAQN
jgi:hypothetical protein